VTTISTHHILHERDNRIFKVDMIVNFEMPKIWNSQIFLLHFGQICQMIKECICPAFFSSCQAKFVFLRIRTYRTKLMIELQWGVFYIVPKKKGILIT